MNGILSGGFMTQDAIKDFLLKTLHYTRFELEYARADSDAWLGHVAFGYMLVSEFRPNLQLNSERTGEIPIFHFAKLFEISS